MAYNNQASLERILNTTKLEELLSDIVEGGTGQSAEDTLSEAGARATALVDAYYHKRYASMEGETSLLKKSIEADIIIYYLYRRTSTMPEIVRIAYVDAIINLERIASGKIQDSSFSADATSVRIIYKPYDQESDAKKDRIRTGA